MIIFRNLKFVEEVFIMKFGKCVKIIPYICVYKNLIMEDLYVKYKKLLEYFVTHLEYAQSDYSQSTRGYLKYISPIKGFTCTGCGHKGQSIQDQIKSWDEYNGHKLFINVNNSFGNGYSTNSCYLNWKKTWLNTKAKWDRQKQKIISLYLSKEKRTDAPAIKSYTLEELGLFDDKLPNKNLKDFFDSFYLLILEEKRRSAMIPYLKLLETNKNLIFTGAPGTGKTYLAKQIAEELGATIDNGQCMMVQFHPSYDYTDFVEGLRPTQSNNETSIGFELKEGSFKVLCANALKNLIESKQNNIECKKFVFIIDEINRGEISKIFGELFFCIDPGYRGEKGRIKTQYNNLIKSDNIFKDGFYVPENVYIIGTMNDIDRSVDSMDFAMRRRFAWKEISCFDRLEMLDDLDDLKDIAKEKMKSLNKAIEETEGLSRSYHIGPAYFRKILEYKDSATKWDDLWNYHIKGLLYEYIRGTEETKDKMIEFKNAYDKGI